jgi:hypothetical protein
MAKNHPLWGSFAAGEISPRLYSRSDTDAWKAGLASLVNFVATSHGPVIRRLGYRFALSSGDDTTPATDGRVFGFPHTREQGFHICITDKPELIILDASDRKNPVVVQTIPNTPWTQANGQLQYLYGDYPPEGEKLILVCQKVAPQVLTYDPDAAGDKWTLAPVSFTGKPSVWTGENWPSCLAFFQGRMWLAGTPNEPQTLWGSRSEDLFNFTVGSQDAADGIEFVLSRRGKIEWLGAAKNLIIGTINQEYLLTSEQGVITTTDKDAVPQSSYGSKDIQAQLLGNVMLYVSPDGRKLRDIGYRWEENNWLSRDITFLSEHITLDNAIRGITWSQQPNNLILMATEDGKLLGCTYERYHDVIGWHRHETQGEYKASGVVEINGISEVVHAIKRVDNSIYFELESVETYMDSFLEVVPDEGNNNQITLAHLPNKTVQVTVGGAIHPDVTLDENGNGNLQFIPDPDRPDTIEYTYPDGITKTIVLPDNVVKAGLGYTSSMQTLPMDYTPEEPGTSAHWMKRWNKVYVRTLSSVKPRVYKDRPPERHPVTPMNLAEPAALLEDVKVVGLGWNRFSQVYVEQDLPLSLTVTGIFGEMTQEADD